MKNFAELATIRRSVRQYTGEPLLPEQVEQIMRTALMSPTSKNSRTWQFILVEEKEMLKKLSVCKSSGATFIENCALAIVVLTDPLQSEAHVEDSSIVTTMIQLQVEDLGLGSCWVQIRGRETESGYDSEQYVKDLLEIPLQLSIGCIIAIGHKAKESKPHNEEKLQWEKLHIGKYGNATL
ncbi:MAG: FMN reductase [Candidatus Ordinivivax streblomastigis]|uniref:FMN reductase n=1 Tax=Candidatus Ordinivivax streblomastigis TaxID=2540710 RepID=A0A5M8P2X3_9BACT|nr:MAG: FMN reductase [Candidatus Ordinivivax streblomastigis]